MRRVAATALIVCLLGFAPGCSLFDDDDDDGGGGLPAANVAGQWFSEGPDGGTASCPSGLSFDHTEMYCDRGEFNFQQTGNLVSGTFQCQGDDMILQLFATITGNSIVGEVSGTDPDDNEAFTVAFQGTISDSGEGYFTLTSISGDDGAFTCTLSGMRMSLDRDAPLVDVVDVFSEMRIGLSVAYNSCDSDTSDRELYLDLRRENGGAEVTWHSAGGGCTALDASLVDSRLSVPSEGYMDFPGSDCLVYVDSLMALDLDPIAGDGSGTWTLDFEHLSGNCAAEFDDLPCTIRFDADVTACDGCVPECTTTTAAGTAPIPAGDGLGGIEHFRARPR